MVWLPEKKANVNSIVRFVMTFCYSVFILVADGKVTTFYGSSYPSNKFRRSLVIPRLVLFSDPQTSVFYCLASTIT